MKMIFELCFRLSTANFCLYPMTNGLECGISLRDFIDFKEKDIIESYQIQKIERTI